MMRKVRIGIMFPIYRRRCRSTCAPDPVHVERLKVDLDVNGAEAFSCRKSTTSRQTNWIVLERFCGTRDVFTLPLHSSLAR
jgi:hypothetical protein